MTPRADRPGPEPSYGLRFGTAAFILVSGTLVLVLFVLPQRYVLSAGFRESGASFPTPSTPFVPVESVPIGARVLPDPPVEIPPGPAELFWAEVIPSLEIADYAAALPVFERYLDVYPSDTDVRREYAITLLAAEEPEAAVPVLRDVLADGSDLDLQLLLARTLRELGRTSEAALEYEALSRQRADDMALALEWAQALAWEERYDEAASVIAAALDRGPGSVDLRIELARVYYSVGDLESAAEILAGMDDATLAASDALTLRDDIVAALTVPEFEPVFPELPPPTLLERAVSARIEGDFDESTRLFEEALEERPDDADIWRAYADLLEYELGDVDGARTALLEVERLTPPDVALQYRLAQLEVWTDRTDAATERLLALLAYMDTAAVADPPPEREDGPVVGRADVHALLGDLYRWDGDRIEAARRYETALAEDPDNERARGGLDLLQVELARVMVELEAPRIGGSAYSLADTDDFTRVDLAGEWAELRDDWVWGGSLGNRWLTGFRPDGAVADQGGIYAQLDAARWWRWGTVRTGLQFGAERVRSAWDYSLGGSLRHRGRGGRNTGLQYSHGPGYPLANTLQSVFAQVVQDRLTLNHARPVSENWSLSATLDGAWLRASADSIAPGQRGTARLQGALALGRPVSQSFTLGLTAQALTFTRAAPTTGLGNPLFWDPRSVLSAGPYVQLNHELSTYWRLTGRLSPGLAFIDERRIDGLDAVPHFAAETGIRREGSRFWTALDLFYYQGQFDGYRTYGARLTFSARDLSVLRGDR